ncbi:MAG: MCE family protein [Actinobacteria bacterium]|nr:MAG: MCE family protein [Actinomycetota bacterium]
MSRRSQPSIAGSPILIGAVTVLVTVVAVLLSYNANSGLPFVPTYHIKAEVPDAAGLIEGNEVRIGGKRVGTIDGITGKVGPHAPYAVLALKLDKTVQPLRDDSQLTVRPRSPLGLKYLELVPGRHGRPLNEGGKLSLVHARRSVELDEVINTFDAQTRAAIQRTTFEFGTGLAGRGIDFNRSLASAPVLLLHLEHVAATLADPRTGLRQTLRAVAAVAGQLAQVSPQLGSLFTAADRTFAALDSVRPAIAATLDELPGTELTAITALAAARPVLHDARGLVHDLRPGIGVLPLAAGRLHLALQRGIPVLGHAGPLYDRVRSALDALEALAADPLVRSAVRRLNVALESAIPTVRFVAPAQVRCNYLGVYLRNEASTIAEGDDAGTWLRTLTISQTNQFHARSSPSPDLHTNPYPYTAAPGQHGLCEAGNEPYLPGQRFGHVPGVTAHYTEDTSPPPGVGR